MSFGTLYLGLALLALRVVPDPPGAIPLPCIEREGGQGQAFVVASERAIIVGDAAGEFEVWIWPFKVVERIRPWIRLSGEEAVPLGDHLMAFAQRPNSASALYRLPSGQEVTMHLFLPADKRGAGLIFDAPGLPGDAVVEVHLSPSLRMAWPASSDGISPYMQVLGEEAVVIFNAVTSGPQVFAAVTGTYPLRERVLPEGGASVAEPMPPGGPVVLGIGLDEKGWEPAADQAREVVRHHAFEVKSSGERYAKALGLCSLSTSDPVVDEAFTWGQLALMRGRVRSVDGWYLLTTGYGPSGTGAAPGPAWTTLRTLRHAARLAGPLGLVEPVSQALDELMRRTAKADDGRRLLCGLLSISDRAVAKPDYRYAPEDAPAELVLALAELARWTGDERLLRKHATLLDESLQGWTPASLGSDPSLERIALWWEASGAAEVLLGAAEGTVPGVEALHGARAALEGQLTEAWDAETGWFSSSGDPAPVSQACVRFVAASPSRLATFASYLENQGLIAPWGVRTLAPRSPAYRPDRLGSGAVDPAVTAEVAIALREAEPELALDLALANAKLMSELCPGGIPAAVRSDGLSLAGHPWDTAATALVGTTVLEGLLGLEPDPWGDKLTLRPLPGWDASGVELRGLHMGRGEIGIVIGRAGSFSVSYRGEGAVEVIARLGDSELRGTVSESQPLTLAE